MDTNMRPPQHRSIFGGPLRGLDSLVAAIEAAGGGRPPKDFEMSFGFGDPRPGTGNGGAGSGKVGVRDAETALRQSVDYLMGVDAGVLKPSVPIAGLNVAVDADIGPRRALKLHIVQTIAVDVPQGVSDAQATEEARRCFPDYNSRSFGREARHHVFIGDLAIPTENDTYAVLPLRAITNAAGPDFESVDDAIAFAAAMVTDGGHKQIGRPHAVVKVCKVVEAERPIAAQARDINDDDFH